MGILDVFDMLLPHLKMEVSLHSSKISDIFAEHIEQGNIVLLTEKALDRKFS